MINIKSQLNHMFPCNGALIKTEKNLLKTAGNTFVATTVVKDGHTFTLHVVDPMDSDQLRAYFEQQRELKNQRMNDGSKASFNANTQRKSG